MSTNWKLYICLIWLLLTFVLYYSRYQYLIINKTELFVYKEQVRVRTHGMCLDVFQIPYQLHKNGNKLKNLTIDLQKLHEAKKRRKMISYDYYSKLGRYLPSSIEKGSESHADHSNVKMGNILDKLDGQLPYLNCPLRKYKVNDIIQCLKNKQNFNRTLRMYFIGDSRGRQLLEVLIQMTNEFNYTITDQEGSVLDIFGKTKSTGFIYSKQLKEEINARNSNYPNLLMKFIWAPLIREVAAKRHIPIQKLYLKNQIFLSDTLANNSIKPGEGIQQTRTTAEVHTKLQAILNLDKSKMPDFIFISCGIWYLVKQEYDLSWLIDHWSIDGNMEIFETLKKLADRTKVILFLPYSVKEFTDIHPFSKNFFPFSVDSHIKYILSSQLQLIPKNVIFWDSFLPVVDSTNKDCKYLRQQEINFNNLGGVLNYSPSDSNGCFDCSHTGLKFLETAVQMILNQACNAELKQETSDNYCCSRS